MTAPTHGVVRVRWMRGMVTSPVMPLADAGKLLDELIAQTIACGDGCGFITLEGFDGRQGCVRGRDVVAIECVPDGPDRIRPADPDRPTTASYAAGGYVDGLTVNGQAHDVTPATSFLRRQVERQASMARHPSRCGQ